MSFPAVIVFRNAVRKWGEDNALRLAAALSYYTVFSFGPVLVLATGIAGLFFGYEAAQGALAGQLEGLLGKTGADAVQGVLATTANSGTNLAASLTGLLGLLIGASGVFVELKAALNQIWKAEPRKVNGVVAFVRDRLISFAMVAAIGFLLLVSLVLSAVLTAAAKYTEYLLPIPGEALLWLNFGVSLLVIMLLFALMLKFLPDREVAWRDVLPAALLTSILFSLGKWGIGYYLGSSSVASAFGASASVVVIMLWAYFSAIVFYLGAELSYASAERRGAIGPKRSTEEKLGQGATPLTKRAV